MDMILEILLVFGTGTFGICPAIIVGFAFKLNPFVICTVSTLGAISASFLVSIIGDNIRNRFVKWRYGENKGLKSHRIYKIWNEYGIIGLGLLSPMLLGPILGPALGITLGAKREALLLWMSIGILLWSVFITYASYLGIMGFEAWTK